MQLHKVQPFFSIVYLSIFWCHQPTLFEDDPWPNNTLKAPYKYFHHLSFTSVSSESGDMTRHNNLYSLAIWPALSYFNSVTLYWVYIYMNDIHYHCLWFSPSVVGSIVSHHLLLYRPISSFSSYLSRNVSLLSSFYTRELSPFYLPSPSYHSYPSSLFTDSVSLSLWFSNLLFHRIYYCVK